MAFEVIPAIDLRGGRVVRLAEGDFARETRVRRTIRTRSPLGFAAAGARWIHVVDLDGAGQGRAGRPTTVERIVRAVAGRGPRSGGWRPSVGGGRRGGARTPVPRGSSSGRRS